MKNLLIISMLVLSAVNTFSYTEFGEACEIERKDQLNITIGPGLHCFEKQILADSFKLLEDYTFEFVTPRLADILGIAPTKKSYIKYLQDRMKFVVGNNQYQTSVMLAPPKEIKDLIPETLSWNFLKAPRKYDYYGTSNADCAGCVEFKENAFSGLGTKVTIPGLFEKVLTSPNTQIVNIGAGFFHPTKLVNPYVINSEVNQIHRISIYFHEARHHDQEEGDLGFLHSPCPEGHDLEGKFSCDYKDNGPYTVGNLIFEGLLKECQNCSDNDLLRAEKFYQNGMERVITDTEVAKSVMQKNFDSCMSNPKFKGYFNLQNSRFANVEPTETQKTLEGATRVLSDLNGESIKDFLNNGCESIFVKEEEREHCKSSENLFVLNTFLKRHQFIKNDQEYCERLTRIPLN